MLKASIWDDLPICRFGDHLSGWLDAKSFNLGWPPDLEVWGSQNIQIEAFSIPGHDPRMLKLSNSKFWDPKTLNSKVLTSWGHLSVPVQECGEARRHR